MHHPRTVSCTKTMALAMAVVFSCIAPARLLAVDPTFNVVKITAKSDNPIHETLAGGVVWKQHFDAACAVVDDDVDLTPHPVSAPLKGTYKLVATVEKCPAGGADPDITCTWKYTTGKPMEDSKTVKKSSTIEMEISAPDKVGIYTLQMKFKITDATGNPVVNQTIERRLLVTVAVAKKAADPDKNNRIWYEKACTWAAGAANTDEAIKKVREGFFANTGGIKYNYPPPPAPAFDWTHLIANTAGRNVGDCYQFSYAVGSMCEVLGFLDFKYFKEFGTRGKGFITKAKPSLDPGFPGNIGESPDAMNPVNRYLFSSHSLIERKEGGQRKYHDSTFDGYYDPAAAGGVKRSDFIEWHFTGGSENRGPGAGKPCDKTEDNAGNAGPVVRFLDAPDHVVMGYTWPAARYKVGAGLPVKKPGPPRLVSSCTFTPLDVNADGFFDALAVDIPVTLTQPALGVTGTLSAGATEISRRPSFWSQTISRFSAGAPGPVTARLEFSGEDIFVSGLNGPYTVAALLQYPDSLIADSIVACASGAYNFTSFGERGAYLTGASETTVDDRPTFPGFTRLRATVNVTVRRAGTYIVDGMLSDSTSTVAMAQGSATLAPGARTITLSFLGREIRKHGVNGPYEASYTLREGTGNELGNHTRTTAAYTATSFETAIVKTNGAFSEQAVDLDGNGGFDYLLYQVGMDFAFPGSYVIGAVLADATNQVFAMEGTTLALLAGTRTVSLEFRGPTILANQVNGPFRLDKITVHTEPNADPNFVLIGEDEPGFMSSAYAYTQFDSVRTPTSDIGPNLERGDPTILHQPFEPASGDPIRLAYRVEGSRTEVQLAVYDTRGREVWRSERATVEPGEHAVLWDRRDRSGERVTRGVYFVRLQAGSTHANRKLVLLRP